MADPANALDGHFRRLGPGRTEVARKALGAGSERPTDRFETPRPRSTGWAAGLAEGLPLLLLGGTCLGLAFASHASGSQLGPGRYPLWELFLALGLVAVAGGIAVAAAEPDEEDEEAASVTVEQDPDERRRSKAVSGGPVPPLGPVSTLAPRPTGEGSELQALGRRAPLRTGRGPDHRPNQPAPRAVAPAPEKEPVLLWSQGARQEGGSHEEDVLGELDAIWSEVGPRPVRKPGPAPETRTHDDVRSS